jgi:hypothetical protein
MNYIHLSGKRSWRSPESKTSQLRLGMGVDECYSVRGLRVYLSLGPPARRLRSRQRGHRSGLGSEKTRD